MNYYYVSGTSKGIGKALAEELLKSDTNYVIGFSRTNSIKHKHFEFIEIDLTKPEKVMDFRFINIIDAESISLINNAGMIGHVEHVGLIDNNSIVDVFNININAPAILMNNFIKAYQDVPCRKLVINISSGVSKYPMESWSAYCSSKSALDMFTSVASLEQRILNPEFPIVLFSVAPGIVDTKMQDEIRNVDKSSFSGVGKFTRYKTENKLDKPLTVAQKLIKLIDNHDKISGTILDLRELSL